MTALNSMSTRTAFGMAVVLMFFGIKQWVFTLSAIAVIDDAYMSILHTTLAYMFFILTAQVLKDVIARHSAEKRQQRTPRRLIMLRLPDQQKKRLVRHILGNLLRPQHPVGKSVHSIAVSLIELTESRLVAARGGGQQFLICE